MLLIVAHRPDLDPGHHRQNKVRAINLEKALKHGGHSEHGETLYHH